jgi:hypothetical protein
MIIKKLHVMYRTTLDYKFQFDLLIVFMDNLGDWIEFDTELDGEMWILLL